MWHAGTFTRLASGAGAAVYAINDAGQMVGVAGNAPVMWPSATSQPVALQTGCAAPGYVSQAVAINAKGDITGNMFAFQTCGGAFTDDAYLLPAGGTLTDILGAPVNTCGHNGTTPLAIGEAINAHDQILVLESTCTNVESCTLWQGSAPGTVIPMGPSACFHRTLNDAGVVVGTALTNGVHRGEYSVNGGAATVLPPADGMPGSTALALNNRGDVIGRSVNDVTLASEATLWMARVPPATGLPPAPVNLQSLIPASANITLGSPAEISDNGDIVATATGPGNTQELVVLQPGGQTISGTIRTFQGNRPFTRPLTNVAVALDGTDHAGQAVHVKTTTAADGSYQFSVMDGIYTVAPKGDPPPLPDPLEDPPRGGRYVPTTCSGNQVSGGCQLITAADPVLSADFVYGQDQLLKTTLAPNTIKDDGLGQSTLTISVTDPHGKPVADQYLVARPSAPGGVQNQHFWLCPLTPPHSSPYHPQNGFMVVNFAGVRYNGQLTAMVYGGSAGDAGIRIREPVLNDDIQHGTDGPAGALTFAKPVIGSYRAVPDHISNRVIPEQELVQLIQGGSAPSGLASASSANAVQLLLDWLVAAKAAGQFRGFDFGPMNSENPVTGSLTPVAVLIYRHGDEQVIHPQSPFVFDDPAVLNTHTLVLDSRLAQRLLHGHLGALPTLGAWRQQHSVFFPQFPPGHGYNDRADTYWGWPYPPPPTTPGAARFYQCADAPLPSMQRIVVHSPIRLRVTDGHGRALGSVGRGMLATSLPGMFMIPTHGPQLYEFQPGSDRVTITATATGSANIVVYPPGRKLATPEVFTFPVRRGQTGTLSLTGHGLPTNLRYAGHAYRAARGIALTVRGLPNQLAPPETADRLRVSAQVGEPVPAVLVTATGQGFSAQAVTDGHGQASLTLKRTRKGIKIQLDAPNYRAATIRIK